jgi:hypothetical protein
MKRFGILLLSAVFAFAPVPSDAQTMTTDPVFGEHVQRAEDFADNGNYLRAIDEMRAALALPGISRQENVLGNQSILAYMVWMRDYANAFTQVQSMLAANIGDRTQNLESCLRLALNLERDVVAECGSEVPEDPKGVDWCRSWDCYTPPPRLGE